MTTATNETNYGRASDARIAYLREFVQTAEEKQRCIDAFAANGGWNRRIIDVVTSAYNEHVRKQRRRMLTQGLDKALTAYRDYMSPRAVQEREAWQKCLEHLYCYTRHVVCNWCECPRCQAWQRGELK